MEIDSERVKSVIGEMKLTEKLMFAGGGTCVPSVPRLNVPEMNMGESLNPYYTAEPTAVALGCSFSREICAEIARSRALDAARRHYAFGGTVGAGLIRDPMRADCTDLFSEDPFLTADLLKAYSSGGVLPFVFTDALGQGRFGDRTIDKRALFELYLYPLRKAGKNAGAILADGGYLNGEKISSSRFALDLYSENIEKTAMMISPDGTGDMSYALGMTAAQKKELARAVVNGTYPETVLDARLLRTVYTSAKTYEFYKKPFDRTENKVDLVPATAVLLKNDGTLPYGGDLAIDCYADGISGEKALGNGNGLKLVIVSGFDGAQNAERAVETALSSGEKVVVAVYGLPIELKCADKVNAVLFFPYLKDVSEIVDIVRGTEPRGRLPFSWAKQRESYPANVKKYSGRGDFRYESAFPVHSLLNGFGADVDYPFGHGLSYSQYAFSKFKTAVDGTSVKTEFDIKNIGDRAGYTVVQQYVSYVGNGVYGLNNRLTAYCGISLEAGESRHITLSSDMNDLAVYRNGVFITAGGKYRLDIGLSSAHSVYDTTFKCGGERVNKDNRLETYYGSNGGRFYPTAPEVEHLLGVPFISKNTPKVCAPDNKSARRELKNQSKTVNKRLLPIVEYKIAHTPSVNVGGAKRGLFRK